MKLYADRGMDVLREPEYMAHVQAMTAEALHSKADIAAELAFRDIQVKKARKRIVTLEEALKQVAMNCNGETGCKSYELYYRLCLPAETGVTGE